jgi:hypothetical protein
MGDERGYYAEGLRSIEAREESTLIGARFVPVEEDGVLWEKDGVWYGREAALQSARKELCAGASSTTTRTNGKVPAQSGIPRGYVSVEHFAETVGVTASRINNLIKRGRIEGAERHNNRYVILEDARILPARKETPGAVTDYVKSWHQRNKVFWPE